MYSNLVKSLAAAASILPLVMAEEESLRSPGTLNFMPPRGPKEELYTFGYNTTEASTKNWIGLYSNPEPGLMNAPGEKPNRPSDVWSYTENPVGNEGFETFLADWLEPAYYAAWLFHDDGYEWLAWPSYVYVPKKGADNIKFSDHFTKSEKKWKRGEKVWDNIADLVEGRDKNTEFFHGNIPTWMEITRDDGDFGGKVPDDAEDMTVVIWAIDQKTGAGDYVQIELTIE